MNDKMNKRKNMEKALELTGDHSKNISGKNLYYIHGGDIGHQKSKEQDDK